MIDSPHVDNLNRPDVPPRNLNHTPLPNFDRPGNRNGSTPLGEKMTVLQQQESPEEAFLMKSLQESLLDQKRNPKSDQPELIEKKIEPKKPDASNAIKNNPDMQQGFLMPLVNGLNNTIEGIWKALKSLVPMKPQTGAI